VTEWIPTGRYDTGFSPNAGKNHYGTNLAWGTTYINQPTKIEFDSVLSLTFNAMNPATNYKNGNELHWDWALGMLFSNNFKLGVAGFVYRQLTGDTGSGATLGPFEGRVYGVGPHLVATVPNGRHPVILNLRYYQEFSAVNRFQGRSITFGTTVKLNLTKQRVSSQNPNASPIIGNSVSGPHRLSNTPKTKRSLQLHVQPSKPTRSKSS
jgi:hypothetical protein